MAADKGPDSRGMTGQCYVLTLIGYYSRNILAARLTDKYSAIEVIDAFGEARWEVERIQYPWSVVSGKALLLRREVSGKKPLIDIA
jgi:hypothetical protein